MKRKSARALKSKPANMLPKTTSEITNGGVYSQAIRCGKCNCKCARADFRHTAYYFFSRHNGKLTKTYVRKADLKVFTALVNQARVERAQTRNAFNSSAELLKLSIEFVRGYETLTKSYKENSDDEKA